MWSELSSVQVNLLGVGIFNMHTFMAHITLAAGYA